MKSRKQRVRAPEFVSPMKAILVDQLPTGAEWLYEVKWDGYRALATKHGDSVRLLGGKKQVTMFEMTKHISRHVK
jgi:bifunctional non-homologous end joining protein LigD